jgi:mono/diheme cytochrome c family protein
MASEFSSSIRRVACCSILMGMVGAVAARAAEPADIAAGRRVAEQSCGGCHATGAGPSPLADAPPFRLLYLRYPPEGLGRLLQEGMIAPQEPRDEAPAVFHPRMPIVDLDSGQISDLRTYLESLAPRGREGKPRRQSPAG